MSSHWFEHEAQRKLDEAQRKLDLILKLLEELVAQGPTQERIDALAEKVNANIEKMTLAGKTEES